MLFIPEADLEADFLSQSIVFWDHFEELQTVFIEVKLIINNIDRQFGRQLLCYSNTASAIIRNLTVLSSIADTINCISNHLWHRWRHEYVVNLREAQRASKLNVNSEKLC